MAIAECSSDEPFMKGVRRSVRYYGVAALGSALAVFVGVELWRCLIWLSTATTLTALENAAHSGGLLALLLYILTSILYISTGRRHHLVAGSLYLLLATGSVYGSLDVIISWLGSIPIWAESLPTKQLFLGIFNPIALTITGLVMSAFLTVNLISHMRRHD